MNTQNWTPKPYHKMTIGYPVRAERHATSEKECCIVDANNIWIGDVDVSHAQTIVNAINAAPELLEACKRALITIEAMAPKVNEDRYEPLMALSAAIAKAEGQQ